MRQFDVVSNPHRAATDTIPYLVVLQHDHVQPAPSVIVASVVKYGFLPRIGKLTFEVRIGGEIYLVLAYDMAAIAPQRLSSPVANLEAHRDQFIAAIDLLFTGF
ncbi:MAG: CcdB family protein [Rhizobiales bacterium]|nr:CcdB family protein [Hyphomicrobiales bacterium]